MTNAQSKFLLQAACTCKDFHHPWTEKCANATAGLLLASTPYCLRVYTVVYALSLIMRHRIPKLGDLKRTLLGIIQSTAFLVTNSYTFIMYNCMIRNYLGHYYCSTVAFVPCFLASWTAILVERPARRPLLALYVANVASETLWNMAEARSWVRSISHGQTLIFGAGISILLYLYRLGLHKKSSKDPIFNILRILVGKHEEGPMQPQNTEPVVATVARSTHRSANFASIAGLVQIYSRFIQAFKQKHPTCQHKENCVKYAFWGGLKPFVGGITLQVSLKLVMNIGKISRGPLNWRKTVFNRSNLNLGVCMGSFTLLFKAASCMLRHGLGYDDPRFAIPAGIISSIAFTQYPDNTVSLYVLWKMLQIVYNLGLEKGVVPRVPGFIIILYSFCTAVLFHAGILEPKTLRPSYFKFLQAISGDRLSKFNLQPFDIYGQKASQSAKEVMKQLNVVNTSELPMFSLSSF